VPYPRVEWEEPLPRIPIDTFHASCIPAGLRLEFIAKGDQLIIDFEVIRPSENLMKFLDLNRLLRPTFHQGFELWDSSRFVSFVEINGNEQFVKLPLEPGENRLTVYLPELIPLRVKGIEALKGSIAAVDPGPRWLAYGDSITEGWSSNYSGYSWANTLARKIDLDLVNFGYGGSARGEVAIAEQIAGQQAEVISICYGTNCWSRVVHSKNLFAEGLKVFVEILRRSQPNVPIVAISPLLRPDAESQKNTQGASLGDLRDIFEGFFRRLINEGDDNIVLVEGFDLIMEKDLVDGVHPGNNGHQKVAEALVRPFTSVLK
tara:strand:+ start:809 stop:1762 length:954 start_codon:yes stop_codon:yes gene_type:complete